MINKQNKESRTCTILLQSSEVSDEKK